MLAEDHAICDRSRLFDTMNISYVLLNNLLLEIMIVTGLLVNFETNKKICIYVCEFFFL